MTIGRIPGATGIQPTIVDAKGDIIAATAADSVTRLAVGTNDQVLTADSATATGLKWATPVTSGLILLNTTSFSGVSSQSINDVFSATYVNYLIKITLKITGGTGGDLLLRMRVSGTDASGANYNDQFFSADGSSGAFSRSTGATSAQSMRVDNNQQQTCELLLGSPFLTEPTSFEFKQVLNHSTPQTRIRTGFHNLSTSYTGFTVTAPSNMTGSLQVYGYNQ
jgi:hypothetical protein